MGNAYVIFGRTVQSHVLAISTLALVGGTVGYFSYGSKKDGKPQAIETSKGEDINVEELVNNYLKGDSSSISK